VLLLHFRRHAESSFDAEPVHFLLQCQSLYRQLRGATLNLTQVLSGLEAICDEFIAEGAPQQVNISSAMRDSTLAAVQDMRLTAVAQARNRLKPASAEFKSQARQCLQAAVSEVYGLVQLNSHPRFLNSAALRRSQHVLGWTDGFNELDEEEQAAVMAKLRDAQFQAARAVRRMTEDNNSQRKSGGGGGGGAPSTGDSARKANEPGLFALSPMSVPGSRVGMRLTVHAPVPVGSERVGALDPPHSSAPTSASSAATLEGHLRFDVLSVHEDSPATPSRDPDSARTRPSSLPGCTEA
jgi:hypothetical protein